MGKFKPKKKESNVKIKVEKTLFEKLEQWFETNDRILFIILCGVTLLLSFLNFNLRVSEGGDDSLYILSGHKYAQDFFNYFHQANAPLYPLFLSLPIKLFGVNLAVLKTLSVIFHFFSFWFFYKAFVKRIPYLVLYPVILFYAVNSYILYYASQTYNEAFYLFFQSLFLFCFFKLCDRINDKDDFSSLKTSWPLWLAVGLLMVTVSHTKSVAVVIFPVVVLFFLLQKQWKTAVIALVVSVVAWGSWAILKKIIWGNVTQFTSQKSIILQKDPYKPDMGMEDFGGFVNRFFENSEIYLSRRFFEIIGFPTGAHTLVTFIIILLVLIGIITIVRTKHKTMLFSCLLTGALIATTFIALQTAWAQHRLILIHIPVMLLVIYYGLFFLFKNSLLLSRFYISIVAIICCSILISSVKKAAANAPVLAKNLSGDLYYGFTPDWVNFLKMSRWCADNLPENAVVVSRKAPMSFIYGKGKEFFSINSVPFYDPKTGMANPDSIMNMFEKKKIQYVMMPSLRAYPEKSEVVISTIHSILRPVTESEKYKGRIKLVHREGEMNDEPCYLFEILNK